MKILSKWLMPAMMAFAVMASTITVAAPADGIYASPIIAYTIDAEAIASIVPIPASSTDSVMASDACGNCHKINNTDLAETTEKQSAPVLAFITFGVDSKSEVGWRM